MCYNKGIECWGSEAPDIVNGNVVSSCMAHVGGGSRTPVLWIVVSDEELGVDGLSPYLEQFVTDELRIVPGVSVIGKGGGMADVLANICEWKYSMTKAKETDQPSHVFISWDFEHQPTFDRLDNLLANGVIIQSVTR